MTNRERIDRMTNPEFVGFLKSVRSDQLFPYKDYVSWLNSDDDKPSVRGRRAVYLGGSSVFERKAAENAGLPVVIERIPCIIVSEQTVFGAPYYTIVLENGATFVKVPVNMVEEEP